MFKRQIFPAIVAILFGLPLLQMQYGMIREKPLKGAVERVACPALAWDGLLNRQYQQQFEKWFEQNVGLKSLFVRMHNQLYYSVFRQTPDSSIAAVGKKEELYERSYIESYLNFKKFRVDEAKLALEVGKAARLQKALQSRGVAFLVLITPSKAVHRSARIPGYYHPEKRTKSGNYAMLKTMLDEQKVAYVDGPAIIDTLQADGQSAFPRGGIHWNDLGVHAVAQAVLESLGQHMGRRLDGLAVKQMRELPAKDGEVDLAELLNLVSMPDDFRETYIEYEKQPRTPETKINVLLQGGSFNWKFISVLDANDVFGELDMFYYYSKWHHFAGKASEQRGKIQGDEWCGMAVGKDAVILEINESIVHQFAGKFVDDFLTWLESHP